jgi:hypothetical protein
MSGKRVVENNNAAFDMKSLGKHIEAVSSTTFSALYSADLIHF